jgi:ketosteroid isomerase-like protein
MLVIDPYKTWERLVERLDTELNPLHRRQLEKIIHHMKGEAKGDFDQVLATVSPNACYMLYENPNAPPRIFKGHAEIRQHYTELFDSMSTNLEFLLERVVVDDYCVVTEGPIKTALKGSMLRSAGVQIDDLDAYYLSEGRILVVWPFDKDGMILGESIYLGTSAPLAEVARRKLRPEEIGTYEPAVKP